MQLEPHPLKGFSLTQPRAYEWGFSFNGGTGGIMQPPTGVNGNNGQQVQQFPRQPFG